MVAASVRSNAVFSYSSPVRMVEQSSFTLTFLSGVGLGPAAFTLNPERDCPSPEHLSNFCSTGASQAGTQELLCCSAGIKVAAGPALEKGSSSLGPKAPHWVVVSARWPRALPCRST